MSTFSAVAWFFLGCLISTAVSDKLHVVEQSKSVNDLRMNTIGSQKVALSEGNPSPPKTRLIRSTHPENKGTAESASGSKEPKSPEQRLSSFLLKTVEKWKLKLRNTTSIETKKNKFTSFFTTAAKDVNNFFRNTFSFMSKHNEAEKKKEGTKRHVHKRSARATGDLVKVAPKTWFWRGVPNNVTETEVRAHGRRTTFKELSILYNMAFDTVVAITLIGSFLIAFYWAYVGLAAVADKEDEGAVDDEEEYLVEWERKDKKKNLKDADSSTDDLCTTLVV